MARTRPGPRSSTSVNNDQPSSPTQMPAAIDQNNSSQILTPPSTVPKQKSTVIKKRFLVLLRKVFKKPKGKKQWALAIALFMLFCGSASAFVLTRQKPLPPTPIVQEEKPVIVVEPPKPTTEPSRLTGVEIAIELNSRPVTGVMIENSPDARPQAGLKDAGIVFEAVAEGGITRFLALFLETQPDHIGPVRSVRPYYLDWLMPFDASLAHVGGSPEALAQIKSLGVKDLDQFANGGAYSRSSARFAPHNVYTTMSKMNDLNTAKGFVNSSFTSFARKPDAPAAEVSARTIDLTISSFLYNVHYDYDPTSNSYKRSQAGKPHNDERSGSQLSPKVVVAMIINKGVASDGLHSEYGTVGTGQLYVFQDGMLTIGTWQKVGRKDQFIFTDANNAPLKLNAGQTWITMVNQPGSITSKP